MLFRNSRINSCRPHIPTNPSRILFSIHWPLQWTLFPSEAIFILILATTAAAIGSPNGFQIVHKRILSANVKLLLQSFRRGVVVVEIGRLSEILHKYTSCCSNRLCTARSSSSSKLWRKFSFVVLFLYRCIRFQHIATTNIVIAVVVHARAPAVIVPLLATFHSPNFKTYSLAKCISTCPFFIGTFFDSRKKNRLSSNILANKRIWNFMVL